MSEFYTVDSALADSLRIDASIASPGEQEMMRNAASMVKRFITEEYDTYVQPVALTRIAQVEDRLVMMSKTDFERFDSEWDGSGDETADDVLAITFRLGDIIVIKEPSEVWPTFDDEAQKGMISQFGDEATARRAAGNIVFFDTLTHEVVHQFQDDERPRSYLEVATRYYQRQATKHVRLGHADNPTMNESIALYERFLDSYGDDMHNVFFGKSIDPALRDTITHGIVGAVICNANLKHLAGF